MTQLVNTRDATIQLIARTTTATGYNAVTLVLLTSTSVVNASNSGIVSTLPTGNSASLYIGGTKQGTGVVFGVTGGTVTGGNTAITSNGLTLTINNTTGAITLTGTWSTASDLEIFYITAVYNSTTYTAQYTITKAKTGIDGSGSNAISAILTNDAAVVPADAAGTADYTTATTTMVIYNGTSDDSANGWVYSTVKTANITTSTAANNRTQTVTIMTTDTGYIDITATKTIPPALTPTVITKRFVIAKSKSGGIGTSPTAYWLVLSAAAVKRNGSNQYTPTGLVASAMMQTGTNAPTTFTGAQFKLYENGNAGVVASGALPYTYTPTGNTLNQVKVELYLADGVTKLDEQSVPIILDGSIGTTGQSNYRVYIASSVVLNVAPASTTAPSIPPAYSSTPVNVAVGQTQYISDGVQAAGSNTIVWGIPYPSYFKVGSLEAITASTGTLSVDGALTIGTTGYINTLGNPGYGGSGIFLGYNAGAYKFSVGGLTFDGVTLTVPAAQISGTIPNAVTPPSGWLNQNITLSAAGVLSGGGNSQPISLPALTGSLATAQLGAIIDATKFAAGVEPVTIVTGSVLPTTKSTTNIFLGGTGKLYRWNGSAYISTVDTTDLSGNITASQLATGLGSGGVGNLILNGSFDSSTTDGWGLVEGAGTFTPVTEAGGRRFAQLQSGVTVAYGAKAISVIPGETYLFSANVKNVGAASIGGTLYFRVNEQGTYPATGLVTLTSRTSYTEIAPYPLGTTTLGNNVWVSISGTYTAPANVYWVSPSIYNWGNNVPLGVDDAVFSRQIVAGNIKAGAITATELAADSVIAGKIRAGAVGADQIAAGAIRTDKLLVTGRGKALNDDPACSDASAWTVGAGSFVVQIDPTAPFNGTSIRTNSTVGTQILSRLFPVEAGKTYKVSMYAKHISGNSIMYIRQYNYNAAGVLVNSTVTPLAGGSTFEPVAATTSWTRYSGYIVAGPASVKAQLLIHLNWNSVGVTDICDLRSEEYIGGDLIVNGAITAEKITVGQLSALSANLGSITAGDVHGARFHAGNFTGYSWPAKGPQDPPTTGFYLGPEGILFGNGNVSGGDYFQITADGKLYSQGWSIENGVATFRGIKISNTGVITGIGDGNGTAVANSLLVPSISAAAVSDNLFTGSLANPHPNTLGGASVTSTGFTDIRGTTTGVVVNLPTNPGYVYYHIFDQAGRLPGYYTVSLKLSLVVGMSIVVSTTDGTSWDTSNYTIATTNSATPVWVTVSLRQYLGPNAYGLDVAVGSYFGPAGTLGSTVGSVGICDLFVYPDTYTGVSDASNDLVLTGAINVTISGNKVTKINSSGWDGGAYSREGHTGGAYATAKFNTNQSTMIGLSTNPAASPSYTSIDHAVYWVGDGRVQVYRNEVGQGEFFGVGSALKTDVFSVVYDGRSVFYIRNGAVFYQYGVTINTPLYFDCSLTGIGAVIENCRFGPTTKNTSTNLLDTRSWVVGSSGTQPGFGQNATSSTGLNYIEQGTLPNGENGVVWTAKSGTAVTNNPEGGFDTSLVPVDKNKMYRFSIWIRLEGDTTTGNVYLGCGGGSVNELQAGVNTNPYFMAANRSLLPASKWLLVVGYVYPANYAGNIVTGAIYRGDTGAIVGGVNSFRWTTTTAQSWLRTYQYYTTTANAFTVFWAPRIDVCDGTEQSVSSMLSMGSPSARNPITSTTAAAYISSAAIGSAQIADLRTTNYVEDGVGSPMAGAKLSSTGTSLKVAANNLQVGTVLFTDYWFRLVNAIDGSFNNGKVIWRGNNDVTTLGGAPNVNTLSIRCQEIMEPSSSNLYISFGWTLQPTATSDNLDSMRYMKVELYRASDTAPALIRNIALADRLYVNIIDSSSLNAVSGDFMIMAANIGNGNGTIYHPTSPNSFYGHLRVTLYNAFGASAARWFHGSSGFNGTSATANIDNINLIADNIAPGGAPAAGGGGGTGGFGGYCPAPWVKIALVGGKSIAASDLYDGAKVIAVKDSDFSPVEGGGTIRGPRIIWQNRIELTLTNGKTTEWSTDHRFYTINREWVHIQNLVPGDVIAGPVENIVQSIKPTGEGPVVTFQVEGAGTYFGDDLLCHNRKVGEIP